MATRRGNTVTFDGDDIAAAFGWPSPSTKCGDCGHDRYRHRRVIVKPGLFDGIEKRYECERRDRRRKSGICPCEQFAEPTSN